MTKTKQPTAKQKFVSFLIQLELTDEQQKQIAEYVNLNYKAKTKPRDWSYFDDLIDIFAIEYSKHRSNDYVHSDIGLERKYIGNILQFYKGRRPQDDSLQTAEGIRDMFSAAMNISEKHDPYVYRNMNISYLSNNLNKIITIIHDINNSNRTQRIGNAINRHFDSNE